MCLFLASLGQPVYIFCHTS
uniref:Uncharacterized protein n=1 Tax=Anguilla anguilla TaxID=7936 RepID=A0A0E9PC18_ANGAN